MKAQGMRKRSENIPENPEEYNALLEFPNLNPYSSFLVDEDEPDPKSRKKEKSSKYKREKNKKSSKRGRHHRETSKSSSLKQADCDTSEEEISPWPVEWQRAKKSQGVFYEDSDDSKRRTCAAGKGESDGYKEGNSRQMSGKTERDENAPGCSFWKENESIMSVKEISNQPVDPSQLDDSNNINLCFIHKQGSDTERHGSSRYTDPEKRGAVSERVASLYENESHSKGAGKEDRRPQTSATSNDQRFDIPALMPDQFESIRDIDALSLLCQLIPEQKCQMRHSNNSAVNLCNTSRSVCPLSEFADISHQAQCSKNLYFSADNNVTQYSGGEGGLPYERYIGSSVVSNMTADPVNYACVAPGSNSSNEYRTAYDVKTISYHEPVAPTTYDHNLASIMFPKEPQTSGQGQTVASYLPETPLNVSITADNRPCFVMHPTHQSEDAQGSTPRQYTASHQPSSSAEANQDDLSQNICSGNVLCDIIIRSVPISFLNTVQATAQNQPQGDTSGSAAIHLVSSDGLLKGILTITINHASNIDGEKVPATSVQDTMMCMCSPSNEQTACICRKRIRRYSSHQKPQKDNENLADDVMGDEFSDDNQQTTTK